MTKKRIVAIVVLSPLILVMLIVLVFAALVFYAVTGKWELKELVHAWAN